MQITHDLAIGGLQQVIVNICRTINRELFDVSVLCLRGLGEFVPVVQGLGINVFCLPQGEIDYFPFLKIARILRQQKIDVLHVHNTQPLIEGTISSLLTNVRTIIHTDHARNFPDKLRYMIAEWLVSHFVYKMVGVSEHTSKNLQIYEKISHRKIITIHNGIDGTIYDGAMDTLQKKTELGIHSDGPVIGLGVRLSRQKGITYLLKAMPHILAVHQDATLVIAGDGPLKSDLEAEVDRLGLGKAVIFVGARSDMHSILKCFDIYILPSLWEGLPMVLLEAMAAGVPIIATDVGGNHSAIKHSFNGSLIPPKDPVAIYKEINKLLSDKTLRESYIQNGRKVFKEKFSAEIMTKQYEALYLRKL